MSPLTQLITDPLKSSPATLWTARLKSGLLIILSSFSASADETDLALRLGKLTEFNSGYMSNEELSLDILLGLLCELGMRI